MVVHALKTHSPRLHWTRRFPTTIRQSVSSRLTAYRKSSWLSVNQYFQKISKYISRISYRFCVFFVNKNTVDFLIENHPIIILKDHTLIKIRRIIIPAKRIMISMYHSLYLRIVLKPFSKITISNCYRKSHVLILVSL